MEIKGQLIQKLPVSSGTSQKGQWQSQEIVIETKQRTTVINVERY